MLVISLNLKKWQILKSYNPIKKLGIAYYTWILRVRTVLINLMVLFNSVS